MLVKKINLKCLLMLTILFLSSCENKNIINSTTPNSVRNVFSTIIDNPQDVKCLFRVSSGINWTLKDGENVATPIKTNYCYAYISDGTNFISPNTINAMLM
ncbi:hypothetical protein SDC9_114153 [bioreactor metagenome]|uniref:Uncharacterized protein n=1 Tax=bioreactor metagenome TaxID=1076179 RepID=A0A645BPU5_9ZZZZ